MTAASATGGKAPAANVFEGQPAEALGLRAGALAAKSCVRRRRGQLAAWALCLAAGALGLPCRAQQHDAAESKPWWQDLHGEVLMPLGDWDVYGKDGLRIDNESLGVRLKLNARLFADAADIRLDDALRAAFPQDEGAHSAITQARLSLQGWVFDLGRFKLQLEFAERFQIKDSWFRFNPLPTIGAVTLGNMKEPFSLDALGSSASQTFMVNALPALAFAPGRNIGVMAHDAVLDGRMTWAIGGYWNTASYSSFAGAKDALSNAIGFDASGRVTGLPSVEDGGRRLTHLGLSLSRQSFSAEMQVRAAPETALASSPFADTGLFRPEAATLVALEFARVMGPWSVQGEAMLGDYRAGPLGNPRLSGGYVFVSHVLSGEHRRYDRSEGVFDGVVPRRDFSLAPDAWGAFEVALRVSALDLNSQGLAGGRQRDLSAALNWYLNPGMRLMLNLVHVQLSERANPPAVDSGRANIWQARWQMEF